MKDNIYKNKREKVGDFQFDEKTVSVFPDMIERSVPGYRTLVSLIGTISAKYAKPDTNIYDLGCSLGAASFSMSENLTDFNSRIIAVDKSEAMISRLEKILEENPVDIKIIPVVSDVRDIKIEKASFVVMNLTLQFVSQEDRDSVIHKIYEGMNEGAAFILSEKITFDSEDEENTIHELLHNFKKCRGYSDIEIAQKKEALKNVLIPETFNQHKSRLENAGFSQVYQWFQGFNFISLIGIK
jgi:tRNA (cmo5U34)-methyltransferase